MTNKEAAGHRDYLLRAYKVIKAYLKPGTTVEAAAAECGVDPKTARRYLGNKELINELYGIKGPVVRERINNKLDDNKHRRNV